MGYMKQFLMNIVEILQNNPEKAKVGEEIEVTTPTPDGDKTFKHTVTEDDLFWLKEMTADG